MLRITRCVPNIYVEITVEKIDMEDTEDIFLETDAVPARVGGRFRPKIKPRPSRVAPKAAASVLPSAVVEESVTLSTTVSDIVPNVKSVDVGDGQVTNPVSPSLATLEIVESIEPAKNNKSLCTNVQIPDSDKASELRESSTTVSLQPEVAASHESGHSKSSIGKSAGENADMFSELECLDDGLSLTARDTFEPIDLERRTGKFQPKLKVKKGKENLHIPHTEVDSTTVSETANLVPSVTCEMNKSPHPGDVFDQPSPRLGESSTLNIASDSQVNIEKLAEATPSNGTVLRDSVHSEDVGGTPETESHKSRSRKASTASNLSQKSKSKEAEGGTSSRPKRKRLPRQQVDELVHEANEDSIATAPSDASNVNEDDNNDDEYREPKTSKRKTAQRKSKKPASEKEEPVQQRKRAKKAPDQSTKDPPKKFSHSTRRNRRHVNKSLLEIPEDELDPHKLTIKDLIRITEHKEQLEIKEARKLKTPLPDQSANNDSQKETLRNEEETLTSEHDRNSNGDEASYKVAASTFVLNYQSFMDKAPSGRWSKQDTELFYEALQQCGSDFRMVQELYFPGRTRHQVMLKFKKEERQHPSRIDGVLQGKMKFSTDNCHLTKYIEKLKQAAQERESNADEPTDMTGKEEEDTGERAEKGESEELQDGETDVAEDKEAEVNNPLKNTEEFDEDDFTWDE